MSASAKPSLANFMAIALPIPLLAPVTIATRDSHFVFELEITTTPILVCNQ
jgi:hypothetical protein